GFSGRWSNAGSQGSPIAAARSKAIRRGIQRQHLRRPVRLRDKPASAAPGPLLKSSSSYGMAIHPSGSDDCRFSIRRSTLIGGARNGAVRQRNRYVKASSPAVLKQKTSESSTSRPLHPPTNPSPLRGLTAILPRCSLGWRVGALIHSSAGDRRWCQGERVAINNLIEGVIQRNE